MKLEKKSEMVVHYKDAEGRDRIKGGAGLKASQAYPRRFLFSIGKVLGWHIWFELVWFFPSLGTLHHMCSSFKKLEFQAPIDRMPPPPQPRFGVAVAKTRSIFVKENKRRAARFLRAALKNESNKTNSKGNVNKLWLEQSDLGRILEFLARQ